LAVYFRPSPEGLAGHLATGQLWSCAAWGESLFSTLQHLSIMAQELVTLECTEARKEGKPPSRYLSFRNKKTVTERIEKKKYNPFLKRHTLHKEIK
jgi:large subunit ribosomal protein L33